MTIFSGLARLAPSIAFLGCTVVAPGNHGDGGGGDGAPNGDSGVATSGTASCGQTVTCVGACPANDDPCAQACFDKASPAGQQLILALVACIDKNKCADAPCVQASCATDLNACIQDVEAPPLDGGAPPTMGAPLPADLVGKWQAISSQFGQTYTFNANGTWTGVFLYDNSGACISILKMSTTIDGLAEVQGSTLTLTRVMGTQTTTDCSHKMTTKPTSQATNQYAWGLSPDKLTLTLTNADGSIAFTKQ